MSPVTLPGSGVSRSRPGDPTGVATESPTDAIVAVTCHPLRSYGPEHQHRHSDLHPIEHRFDVKSEVLVQGDGPWPIKALASRHYRRRRTMRIRAGTCRYALLR